MPGCYDGWTLAMFIRVRWGGKHRGRGRLESPDVSRTSGCWRLRTPARGRTERPSVEALASHAESAIGAPAQSGNARRRSPSVTAVA